MKNKTKTQTASAVLKKTFSLMLSLIMLLSLTVSIDFSAFATSKSSSDAINWVKSKVGTAIDYDGYYGSQCVDLILAYYNYLGVATVGGNGCDYATNKLPSGWTRTKGGTPKVGDILVYAGGTGYGHVAIYESNSSLYHQNAGGKVKQEAKKYTSIVAYDGGKYWGCIHPNFSGTTPTVTNLTVKFNGNGGTVSTNSMSVSKNAIMGKNIPTATRYGYLFDGWYTAASGGTRYTNSTKITSNITLYAHWSKINDYTGGLKSGRIYQIVNKKSGLALQASGTGNGSLVKQQPKNTNNKSQLWKVGFGGGTVFSSVNGGRVMDIKGGDSNMANGAELQLFGFDNDNKDNRTFIPVSRGSGYYSIHALHSNRVLDVAGASTNTGVQIQQYYYTGNAQQLFSFEWRFV